MAAALDSRTQGDIEGLTVEWDWNSEQDCVCVACLWKQIKIILTSAARNVLNLEPRRGEIQQLITPNNKKNPQQALTMQPDHHIAGGMIKWDLHIFYIDYKIM